MLALIWCGLFDSIEFRSPGSLWLELIEITDFHSVVFWEPDSLEVKMFESFKYKLIVSFEFGLFAKVGGPHRLNISSFLRRLYKQTVGILIIVLVSRSEFNVNKSQYSQKPPSSTGHWKHLKQNVHYVRRIPFSCR